MAVYKVCHKMVTTPEIRAEWGKDRIRGPKRITLGDFARKWLRWMDGGKKVLYLQSLQNNPLRKKLEEVVGDHKAHREILKDLHLIEAALATDNTVISCDDRARTLFHYTTTKIRQLRTVAWVNPQKQGDPTVKWLEAGAPKDREHLLGNALGDR
jgi:hypothetical protein